MKPCIVRRVAYRLPGTPKVIWANVLCEREGLALLMVPRPDARQLHFIVIGQQNTERIYEHVPSIGFEFESEDMMHIANKLKMLAKEYCRKEWESLFEPED